MPAEPDYFDQDTSLRLEALRAAVTCQRLPLRFKDPDAEADSFLADLLAIAEGFYGFLKAPTTPAADGPDPAAGSGTLHGQLTGALDAHRLHGEARGGGCACGWSGFGGSYAEHLADVLMPIIAVWRDGEPTAFDVAASIESRRADPDFQRRLRDRVEADRKLLDRLAGGATDG